MNCVNLDLHGLNFETSIGRGHTYAHTPSPSKTHRLNRNNSNNFVYCCCCWMNRVFSNRSMLTPECKREKFWGMHDPVSRVFGHFVPFLIRRARSLSFFPDRKRKFCLCISLLITNLFRISFRINPSFLLQDGFVEFIK